MFVIIIIYFKDIIYTVTLHLKNKKLKSGGGGSGAKSEAKRS